MRPLFDGHPAAAVVFWTVFFGWGAIEIGETWAETRRLRSAGIRRSSEDQGTAAMFFVAIYGGFALAFAAAYAATWAAIGGPRWLSFTLGIVLMVAGIAVRQWAIHTLGPLFTREVRVQEGHTLVTAGPYRLVRHPSYAAGLISDAGFGLPSGTGCRSSSPSSRSWR
jgi:protein-S-isoprenylcysteine O-methyltransferase